MHSNRLLALVLGSAAALCAGCGSSHHTARGTNTAAAVSPEGRPIGKLSTPGTPKGEQTVPIEVIGEKGPQRAAMALVPVRIDGKGPFPFALDTGASTSLIPAKLAELLHLRREGANKHVAGITGRGEAYPVRIGNWTAGKVALPPSLISALVEKRPETPAPAPVRPKSNRVKGPVGLLGSDVLSRYGKIAVDYDDNLLVLDPPVR
jgi:Aspartyl protease